jgi:hypothetical protein
LFAADSCAETGKAGAYSAFAIVVLTPFAAD